MTRIGYFTSSEEFTPREQVDQALMARDAGFQGLWISDHFHPWNEAQGQSGFVWATIGAIAQAVDLPITTAVTCPTTRIHPAIIAQAAATAAHLSRGGFRLGVGTGEALNEHILGDPWPSASVRRSMLEEAVDVMRQLWTGKQVTHHGKHYTVDTARLYTLPDKAPEILVSGFGPASVKLAGKIGDGYIGMQPQADLVRTFHENGGQGKTTAAGYKICWGADRDKAVETAFARWPNELLPGELAQVLPQPRHFEQASELVDRDMVADAIVCGDDVDAHLKQLKAFIDAGYDEIYVNQIGPDQRGFFDFYAAEILPQIPELG
ncbi:MAG TPA: TIGR03557 family F420-dependent LLM class oxidoreductase [Actinocrinis sp.]|nr:TIGR03557 family F420-dependent LLM class oxidoreductase [Actinocrinis sp.]